MKKMTRKTGLKLVYWTYFHAREGWQYRAVCPSTGEEYISLSIREDEARKIAIKWYRRHGYAILQRRRVRITRRRKKHGFGEYGDASYILEAYGKWENYKIYTSPKGKTVRPKQTHLLLEGEKWQTGRRCTETSKKETSSEQRSPTHTTQNTANTFRNVETDEWDRWERFWGIDIMEETSQ